MITKKFNFDTTVLLINSYILKYSSHSNSLCILFYLIMVYKVLFFPPYNPVLFVAIFLKKI